MSDAEIFAIAKLIRGARHSAGAELPSAAWTSGNLRITDKNQFMPSLDLVSNRRPLDDVWLNVCVGRSVIEQWRIMPGPQVSDATSFSLLARSLFVYLRFSELYAELATRSDVTVSVGQGAVLPSDTKLAFGAGSDRITVQAFSNSSWRTALQEHQPVSVESSGSVPGSCASSMPLATPPLAPQANIVGSFGTSPRVGQTATVGAFVLPTATAKVASPATNPACPAVAPDELPPLVPVVAASPEYASPTTAAPARRQAAFGIGTSTFDLDDVESSPASGVTGGPQFPSQEEAQRKQVSGFLNAVSEFYARPTGLPATASVADAARAVLDA